MTRSFPAPLFLCSSPVVIVISSVVCCRLAWLVSGRDSVGQIQQIDQRHDEHPNQIHKVPVEARDLDVIGFVTSTLVAQADYDQGDHAAGYVQQVQAGNAEEQRTEQRR